jgi:hypothetical protein
MIVTTISQERTHCGRCAVHSNTAFDAMHAGLMENNDILMQRTRFYQARGSQHSI